MNPADVTSRTRRIAATLVTSQFILLGVIVLAPAGESWPVSTGLRLVGVLGSAMGLVVMAVAALGLGRGLTASPLPNRHAKLRTGGLYRWVRHPIYSGLLLFALAQVLSSGSPVAAAAGVLLGALITFKARWEERRLVARFADYPAYAAITPRFVPGLRSWRGRPSGKSY